MNLLSRIHSKLGDLWWYSMLLFAAQRLGDVVNMFVGLWLVPHYVSATELGAVLPLVSVVGLIGIPMSIVAIPFLKFVAVFVDSGELGKAKALIRDAFACTAVFAVISLLIAVSVLPFFFKCLRVQDGNLALLLVAVTIVGAISGIFLNAASALKMFNVTVWIQVVAAPLRLVTMAVLMPFRALSGYIAGSAIHPLTNIVLPLLALRKFLCSPVHPEPYWHDYGRAIFSYTWPLALMTAVQTVASNLDLLVIRHYLCDFESAGYYMITRFSEMSLQFSSVFAAFLLPMLAGRKESAASKRLTMQSLTGICIVGSAVTLALAVFGHDILELNKSWAVYTDFAPHMVALAASGTLAMGTSAMTTAFIASGQFGFLLYFLPVIFIKSMLLYALCRISFFSEILPAVWIEAVTSFNPCRLSFVVTVFAAANVINFIMLSIHLFGHLKTVRRK